MGVPNFGNNSGVSLLQVALRTTLASSGFHLIFVILSFYVKYLLALASVHATQRVIIFAITLIGPHLHISSFLFSLDTE